MYQSVSFSSFVDAFKGLRPENFSYDGLSILFDYLEDYEDQTGETIELDVIAICCDYVEYSWGDVAREYSIRINEDDDVKETVLSYLENNTSVCGYDDDVVVFLSF